ncbi:MAG TPA: hypothetical protein PLD30_12740 [Candidatus Competibacteraceae bacterium]|nr:hypothetical protein [Candidatus Competibacteraceae bacterium]
MINKKLLGVLMSLCLIGSTCLASDNAKENEKSPELADRVVGIYYGNVVSDSKGGSRSDVSVAITKLDSKTVSVTSDYGRLGTVVIRLTRIDDKILNANSDTPLILDLEQRPLRLDYSPYNEISYVGYKQ